ncbi:MAG: DNA repair protein RadC [Saprospiraceae bacterium]|nr:DNA repair protein RadC [Saprospiraceae bacterium]
MRIKHLAIDDRPRERALQHGLSVLSDSELIAILLGSGTRYESALDLARRILAAAQDDLHELARFSINKFQEFNGVGEAKAVTIAAALELGRRRMRTAARHLPRISSSADAFDIIRPYLSDKQHEEVWVLFMNQAGQMIRCERVSAGGMTGAVVDPKIILRKGLEYGATRLILVHNHPSGSLTPSQQDIHLTHKLREAAQLMDMRLTDHIIVGHQRYFSFLDEGRL